MQGKQAKKRPNTTHRPSEGNGLSSLVFSPAIRLRSDRWHRSVSVVAVPAFTPFPHYTHTPIVSPSLKSVKGLFVTLAIDNEADHRLTNLIPECLAYLAVSVSVHSQADLMNIIGS